MKLLGVEMKYWVKLGASLMLLLASCSTPSVVPTTTLPFETFTPLPTRTITPTQTLTPTITPTPIGGGSGKIVFVSERDGNPEIYTINTDGTNLTRLTNDPEIDFFPQWSPDGKKVVFTSMRGIPPNINKEIYVMNADGSDQTRLTNFKKFTFGPDAPQWSPDGKKILFDATISYDIDTDRTVSEIYIINADGTELTQLTFHNLDAINPKWSPDGNKIAYSLHDYGVGNVYVINADGTEETRLTFNHRYNIDPEWAPDGTKIAYMSSYTNTDYEIYVINPDGTEETQITRDNGENFAPQWSPDGKKIAYLYSYDGKNSVCIITILEKNVVCNTDSGSAGSPRWSYDGKIIAFGYTYNQESGIRTMNVDGTDSKSLSNPIVDDSWIWQFEWQP